VVPVESSLAMKPLKVKKFGEVCVKIVVPKARESLLTVCSYPKGGTFTTKLDLKN